MEIYDPHNHEDRYKNWKAKGSPINDISESNAELIRAHIYDFEIGRNTSKSHKKGGRGKGHLLHIKSKLKIVFQLLESQHPNITVKDLEGRDDILLELFAKMRAGDLVSPSTGKKYTAVGKIVAHFKTFWQWYMKVQRKAGRSVEDITVDLDRRDNKATFHWITSDMWKEAIREAPRDYKFLLMFMWDTGIRAPKEMMNITVSDLQWDNNEKLYWVNVRDEVSKTFGRKFKLLQFSTPIREYIQQNEFKPTDRLWNKTPQVTNRTLSRLFYKLFKLGTEYEQKETYKRIETVNGKDEIVVKDKVRTAVTGGVTLYDLRHSAGIYWRSTGMDVQQQMYMFGWTRMAMIEYYCEKLGLKDTRTKIQAFTLEDRSEMEAKLGRLMEIEQESKDMKLRLAELERNQMMKNPIDEASIRRGKPINQDIVKEVLKEMILNGEINL